MIISKDKHFEETKCWILLFIITELKSENSKQWKIKFNSNSFLNKIEKKHVKNSSKLIHISRHHITNC